MASLRSDVACLVIPFPQRLPQAGLTPRDRIEIGRWQDDARQLGYDRLVIHDREAGDSPDTQSFLSIYRAGECFSRFGLTRRGVSVTAWCSATGADIGPFASVSDALLAILPGEAAPAAVSAVS